MIRHRRHACTVMVVVTLAGACGGGRSLDVSDEPVIFGVGERPPAIPADFPIPDDAVIGSTMIDRANHRTEMALQVGSSLEAAVRYFNVGLVSQGFVVGASSGSASAWTISFGRDELTGEIRFIAQGGATQVLVEVNDI